MILIGSHGVSPVKTVTGAVPRLERMGRIAVARIDSLARRQGRAPAQLAPARVPARGEGIVPIPGAKRRRYPDEHLAAAGLALAAGDPAAPDGAVPSGAAAAGARHSEVGAWPAQGSLRCGPGRSRSWRRTTTGNAGSQDSRRTVQSS